MTDSMKCGPDGCPIRIFSDLTPAEQRVERQRIAEKMMVQGFTQEQIAKQLHVSQRTISEDLRNLEVTAKLKSTKTASNPKGAGRPKGKREKKPGVKQAQRSVNATPEEWDHFKRKALEQGYASAADKIGELIAEPEIAREALSMTAQEKLASAIKQATRRLEVEIHHRIHAEMLTWLQRQLDRYNENAKHYELILKQRKGLMKRDEYRSILSCLHPDRVQDETLKKRYEHAFNLFTKLEKAILDEKESPTRDSGLPKTAAEWLRREAEVKAQRAAARAAKKSNGSQVQR